LGNGFSGWGVSNLLGASMTQLLNPSHPIHKQFVRENTISIQVDVVCSLKTCASYSEWRK
jgi:hypothetical protein